MVRDPSRTLNPVHIRYTLQRFLYDIHHTNDRFGPVYMSKIDLSDGFYQLWVHPDGNIRLAVIFPTRNGEPDLAGIPLTLMSPAKANEFRHHYRTVQKEMRQGVTEP